MSAYEQESHKEIDNDEYRYSCKTKKNPMSTFPLQKNTKNTTLIV